MHEHDKSREAVGISEKDCIVEPSVRVCVCVYKNSYVSLHNTKKDSISIKND